MVAIRSAPSGPVLEIPTVGDLPLMVGTYEELRAVTPESGKQANTYGRSVVGDAAGRGQWTGVNVGAPGTFTDDGGTVLVPLGGDGSRAWVRQNVDAFDVRWFGATGLGLSDDTVPIQSAIEAAADGGVVFVPGGVFSIAAAILLNQEGIVFRGEGPATIINQTGTNVSNLVISAANCRVSDLVIQGNSTGEGGTGAAGVGGHGVEVRAAGATIERVSFSGIGENLTDSLACCITGTATISTDLTVSECLFDETNQSRNGSDVAVRAARSVIRDNRSWSQMDVGVTVAGAVDSAVRHIVSGNQIRRSNEQARHGIVALYGDRASESIITGNQIRGCFWSGVYVNGAVEFDETFGRVIVADNLITNCAGGDPIGGGILFGTNANHSSVRGNTILNTGFDLAGDPRATPASGIEVSRSSGVVVSNNVVRNTTEHCIYIRGSEGSRTYNVTVEGNTCSQPGFSGAIMVQTLNDSSTGIQIENVNVQGNIVEIESIGLNAVRIVASANGSDGVTMSDINVIGNSLRSTFTGGPASGIEVQVKVMRGSRVAENIARGFARGILIAANASSSIDNCEVADNISAESSQTGVTSGTPFVVLGHIHDGSATPYLGTYVGQKNGINASNQTIVRVYATAAPADGTWRVGDQAYDPATDDLWVCTVAGTPGTWGVLRP